MIGVKDSLPQEDRQKKLSREDLAKIAKIEKEMKSVREERQNAEKRYIEPLGIDGPSWRTTVNEVHQWFSGDDESIDRIINSVKNLIILKENKAELFYMVTIGSRFTGLSSMEMVMGIKLLELHSKSFSKKVLGIYKKYSKNN